MMHEEGRLLFQQRSLFLETLKSKAVEIKTSGYATHQLSNE